MNNKKNIAVILHYVMSNERYPIFFYENPFMTLIINDLCECLKIFHPLILSDLLRIFGENDTL